MSHSKQVYVLTKGNLTKFQNQGMANCAKCLCNFKENDVIATSTTTKRYCYKCATQINLVTGKLQIDLHNYEFIPNVLNDIESIGTKLNINQHVCKLAKILVITTFENTNYIPKNKLGVACASIFLACKIKRCFLSDIDLPVSKKTLQKNVNLLQKNMAEKNDIYALSRDLYELRH
ncbi:MAG: cyclin domain-containing protein [Nitrosopumilus sp.]|nr:cyclin domain-containing protein [Nitrosopumilus sp.]